MFKRIERRPMTWPCQLTIGSSLSIRIVGYKAVSSLKCDLFVSVGPFKAVLLHFIYSLAILKCYSTLIIVT